MFDPRGSREKLLTVSLKNSSLPVVFSDLLLFQPSLSLVPLKEFNPPAHSLEEDKKLLFLFYFMEASSVGLLEISCLHRRLIWIYVI